MIFRVSSDGSSAVFDEHRVYRYALTRGDAGARSVVWIMLNPSTANEMYDDPTIRTVCAFSKLWGYGQVRVVNLFGYRATDPKALRRAVKAGADCVGPGNDAWVRETLAGAQAVVCAWGANGDLADRDLAMLSILREMKLTPLALKFTTAKPKKRAQPVHPLYQRHDLPPVPMPLG